MDLFFKTRTPVLKITFKACIFKKKLWITPSPQRVFTDTPTDLYYRPLMNFSSFHLIYKGVSNAGHLLQSLYGMSSLWYIFLVHHRVVTVIS